jgi:glutamate formiminotransferase
MANGLAPDFGPERPHPTAGATLVTARPPLAAFNLVAAGIDLAAAEAVARRARETGGGPAGLRAIAIDLGDGRLQISTNVHDPINLRLATVTELVRDLVAERGGELLAAEIVGLVPREALAGFPDDLSIEGFDPDRQVIENRLDS